ncbi:MAG TPA: phosphatidylserine decarboxylase [Candidatus Nanoarchaeia archaeon]|nr:phosphatidylserine decarboxylase [Candidatus Nanoarchaeia archaeon]
MVIIFAALIIIVLGFYKFVFLRDPKREIPSGNNLLSPADGKIINILKLSKKEIRIAKGSGMIRALVPESCKDGWLITIMMTVFDVHVQRAPIAGEVTDIKYSKGKFKNAVYGHALENGLENEKNEITIKSEIGDVKVIQIAGYIARRIQCFVSKKQKVNKGERIGRIVIGSQVCLIVPRKVNLAVKNGERVVAGKTIIGTI